MNARALRRRYYELTLETRSPLHTSLGPEGFLFPDEECDVADGRTLVLDREALIAAFQQRAEVAPPVVVAPPRPLTYREVLSNRDHPLYEDIAREFPLLRKLGFATLDSEIEGEDASPPPPSAPADWRALAATRPRELRAADKLWLAGEAGRDLIRYTLRGTPAVPGRPERWQGAIARLPRTFGWAPLLPGSGLKGALRTLIAFAAAERRGAANLAAPRGPNPKSAAQDMERQTLAPHAAGNAPNYDVGRLVIARDTPLDPACPVAIAPFGIATARSWRLFSGGGNQQSATAVEILPPGVTIRAEVVIDAWLLEQWRDEQRRVDFFGPLRPLLTPDLAPLLAAARRFAAAQLGADAAVFAGSHTAAARALTARLTAELAALPPDATLLRVGWGTGRQSKTPFASVLHAAWPHQWPPQRSRRLTARPDGQPDLPFGWVRLDARLVREE